MLYISDDLLSVQWEEWLVAVKKKIFSGMADWTSPYNDLQICKKNIVKMVCTIKLFIRSYSHLSIGSMMNGIEPRPTTVTAHLRRAGEDKSCCDTGCLSRQQESAQIRLIVKPGMTTDARPCHIRVSSTAADGLVLWTCAWDDRWWPYEEWKLNFGRSSTVTYLSSTGSVPLLECMGSYISTRYKVAEVDPSHCYHMTKWLSHFIGIACISSSQILQWQANKRMRLYAGITDSPLHR